MPTANQRLVDESLRHAVYVQRYGSSVVNKVIALLNRVESDLIDKLFLRLRKIEGQGFDTGPDTTARLKALFADIQAMNKAAFDDAGKDLTTQMRDFAAHESAWQGSLIQSALPVGVTAPVVPARLVVAAAMSRPFQGRLLNEWMTGLASAKTARIRDAIRMGVVQGETTDEIVRRIRGTRTAGYADGLLEIDRRSAATIVRTAVTHISNAAREATFADSASLIKGVQWHATLDSHTCLQCGALDGKVFQIGNGIRPPAHFGCRCTTIPLLKSWKDLGIDVADIDPSTRASINGQVPATQTYEDWLSQQTAAFQDATLGPSRGALFRKGGVTLSRFTDRNGGELTLEQLRQANPAEFAKADL